MLTGPTVNRNLTYTVVSVAVLMLGLLLWGSRPDAAADVPKPVTHTVTIEGTGFQPAMLTVKAGDSVVWVNKDPFPHTAVSKDAGLDSKEIGAGASWKFVAATKGEFPYICTLHQTMKGVLRVQ